MHSSIIRLASIMSFTSTILGAPAPQSAFGGSSPICVDGFRYQTHQQNGPYWGFPRLVAGEQCAANQAGCTISDSKSYGVTVTVTVGANLNFKISDIVDAGISGSVSVGKSTSETVSTAVTCPKECVCGLQVTPSLLRLRGDQIIYPHNDAGKDSECVGSSKVKGQYDITVPVIDPHAAPNNQAVTRFSACVVANTVCKADPHLPRCPNQ